MHPSEQISKRARLSKATGGVMRRELLKNPVKSRLIKKAKTLFLAAEQGEDGAQSALAMLLFDYSEILHEESTCMSIIASLKEPMFASAQFSFGRLFYCADGEERNFTTARQWFELGAEHGDSFAIYALGMIYFEGHGVERDLSETMKWFKMLQAKGSVRGDRVCRSIENNNLLPHDLRQEWLVINRFIVNEGGAPF